MENSQFTLTKKQVEEGIRKCFENIDLLIASTKTLHLNSFEDPIAVGLFSFAVEEYGKILVLKEELDKGSDLIKIPKILFRGRESHNLKFGKALEDLPGDARNFSEKYMVEWIKFPESKVENGKLVKKVTEMWEGGEDMPTTMNARMDCFYVDWDSVNLKWKEKPKPQDFYFFSVIEKFEKHITQKMLDWRIDIKKPQKSL